MDPNDSRSGTPAQRSTLAQWVSPDAESSWAALRVNTAVWTLLTVAWLLYLTLGDAESYRLVLYPLLIVVSVLQVLSNVAAMRKKKRGEDGGARWYRS